MRRPARKMKEKCAFLLLSLFCWVPAPGAIFACCSSDNPATPDRTGDGTQNTLKVDIFPYDVEITSHKLNPTVFTGFTVPPQGLSQGNQFLSATCEVLPDKWMRKDIIDDGFITYLPDSSYAFTDLREAAGDGSFPSYVVTINEYQPWLFTQCTSEEEICVTLGTHDEAPAPSRVPLLIGLSAMIVSGAWIRRTTNQ